MSPGKGLWDWVQRKQSHANNKSHYDGVTLEGRLLAREIVCSLFPKGSGTWGAQVQQQPLGKNWNSCWGNLPAVFPTYTQPHQVFVLILWESSDMITLAAQMSKIRLREVVIPPRSQ